MANLYHEDGESNLHVFASLEAYWRWYGCGNHWRDPLQSPRVGSGEARKRIARTVKLPASTPIGRLLDAYRTVHPERVHPIEDDGQRIQPERD